MKVVSSEKRRQVQRPRIFRCLEMTSPRRRRERERERDGGSRHHGGGREHAEVENRFCLLTLRSDAEKIEPCPGVYSIGEGDLASFALRRMQQDLIMVDRYFKCLRG